MNPVIIFHPDERHRAHLVDADAIAVLPFGETGERRIHYLTGVFIGDLDAGEFSADLLLDGKFTKPKESANKKIVRKWINEMAQPRPSLYIPFTPKQHVEETPMHRLIEHRAAVALLKLVESGVNIQTERGRTWKQRPPAIEGEDIPWDQWRFLTAWFWSGWNRQPKKPTLAERFEEVKALGYDRGLKSFEAMHCQMFPKNSK